MIIMKNLGLLNLTNDGLKVSVFGDCHAFAKQENAQRKPNTLRLQLVSEVVKGVKV